MNMVTKEKKNHPGIGVGLGALLGSSMTDQECLQQLAEHGVITEQEYRELRNRVANK